MSKSTSLIFVLFVALCVMVGCGEDGDTPTEPANHSEFYIQNESSVEFEVHAETNTTFPLVDVAAPGASVRLSLMAGGTYTEFTPPSEALTQIELRATGSGAVLYHQQPIVDASWAGEQGAVRVMVYTLVIDDDDLDLPR